MNVMPKMQLTKRNIDKMIPFTESGQVDYFDTELKGLLLRAGKSSKTFYVQVDVRDAVTGKFKTIKEKLGVYGEITPEQARQMAPDIIRRIREGKPAAMPITESEHLHVSRLSRKWTFKPLDLTVNQPSLKA
jgi:hypothetical protein